MAAAAPIIDFPPLRAKGGETRAMRARAAAAVVRSFFFFSFEDVEMKADGLEEYAASV